MEKILKETTVQNLKKAFHQKKEVLAVYVFGSRSGSFATPGSDLDLAMVVSDRKKTPEREMIKFLNKKKIKIPYNLDLTCVDFSSPPLFLFQIIKNGVCLYEKDPFQRVSLEAKILDLYYDNQHLRNIYRQYLQKSIKEGTYGY